MTTPAAASLALSLGIPPSDPQVSSALASVEAQAVAEGAKPGDLEVAARQATLLHSFADLYHNGHVPDAAAALQAARSFVTENHEVSGAIDTAAGLVAAVDEVASGNASPLQVVQSFSGPLIGGVVLTGALTAGAGAAITIGIAAASELLNALHLFAPPAGTEISPGFYMSPAPDFVIGFVGANDASGPKSPGSALWRRFPEPANHVDAQVWYTPVSENTIISGAWNNKWDGAQWSVDFRHSPAWRMIDAAFPEYGQVSTETWHVPHVANVLGFLSAPIPLPTDEVTQTLHDFERGYFTAWKANKEYWLNGRRGGTDAQVLEQFVRVWNRAHLPGKGVDYRPGNTAAYFATQIATVASSGAADILSKDGLGIHINTGPLKKKVHAMATIDYSLAPITIKAVGIPKPPVVNRALAPIHVTLHAPQQAVLAAHQAAAGVTPKAGASTAEKVGIGAAVVAAVGGLAYWLL